MRCCVILAAATLAACSGTDPIDDTFNAQAKAEQQATTERVADARAVGAGFRPEQPKPMETVSVDPVKAPAPGAILPPATAQYRYIGRWAPSSAVCATGVWRFRTRTLSAAGTTSCNLPTVAVGPAGYDLDGVCQTNGVKTPQTLKLSFDEKQHTMRVTGKTLGPIELIYCGD